MKIMELSTKEYEVLVKKGLVEEDKKIEKEDLFKLDESMTKASLVAWQKANNGIFKKKIDELIDKVNSLENKQ